MRIADTRAGHRAAAKPRRPDLDDLKRNAIPHVEAIGIGELGKPSRRTKTAIMWGTKQSTVLNLAGPHCGRTRRHHQLHCARAQYLDRRVHPRPSRVPKRSFPVCARKNRADESSILDCDT
jgi:hypothetical protein